MATEDLRPLITAEESEDEYLQAEKTPHPLPASRIDLEKMFGVNHLELRRSFNRCLTLSNLLIAVSQFNYGFDQHGFSSVQVGS